jgi:hypothetical protein
MKSIEVHVLESEYDSYLAVTAGLLEVDDLDGSACIACYEDVGHVQEKFIGYVVVLDGDSQWEVCLECAAPVVDQE